MKVRTLLCIICGCALDAGPFTMTLSSAQMQCITVGYAMLKTIGNGRDSHFHPQPPDAHYNRRHRLQLVIQLMRTEIWFHYYYYKYELAYLHVHKGTFVFNSSKYKNIWTFNFLAWHYCTALCSTGITICIQTFVLFYTGFFLTAQVWFYCNLGFQWKWLYHPWLIIAIWSTINRMLRESTMSTFYHPIFQGCQTHFSSGVTYSQFDQMRKHIASQSSWGGFQQVSWALAGNGSNGWKFVQVLKTWNTGCTIVMG